MIGTVLCYVLLPAARLLQALRGNPAPGGRRQGQGELPRVAPRGGDVPRHPPPRPDRVRPGPEAAPQLPRPRPWAEAARGCGRGAASLEGTAARCCAAETGSALRRGSSSYPHLALQAWTDPWRWAAQRSLVPQGLAGDLRLCEWTLCFLCVAISLSFPRSCCYFTVPDY